MKHLVLLSGLLAALGGCTALRPPSAAQLTAAQAAFSPTPPTVRPGIHDSPAVHHKQGMPLIFVNGQKYSAARLRRLALGTVDSAYILTPPVSTALYNRRGRNGVVIYTSKKYR